MIKDETTKAIMTRGWVQRHARGILQGIDDVVAETLQRLTIVPRECLMLVKIRNSITRDNGSGRDTSSRRGPGGGALTHSDNKVLYRLCSNVLSPTFRIQDLPRRVGQTL